MSDSNPFAKLQGLLKDKAQSPATAKGSKPSSSSSPSTPAGTANTTPSRKNRSNHDEESALFLHTVNKLPQSSPSVQAQQEDTAFKQAMQAAGIVPVDKKVKGKKHKKRSTTAASTPPPAQQEGLLPPAKGQEGRQDNGQYFGPANEPNNRQDNKQGTLGQPTKKQGSTPTTSLEDKATFLDLGNETTQNNPISDDLDEQEFALFAKAMDDVAPVSKRGREIHTPAETKIPLHPSGKTPAQIMQEIIDGRIEFAIQHTGEYMEGFVQGVSPEVLDKLRGGQLSPEGHVDLHGLNALQAYTELTRFIKNAYQRNMRTVTVITGRGINSPDGIAVIRNLIQEWLTHDPFKRVVLAFCSAQPRDGGAGALYVLLRKYKKSMGKIQWELPYMGPNADF